MRNLLRTRRRKAAAVGATALVVVGAAVAAWIVTSTGSGSGKVGTIVAPTFTAGAAPDEPILPGGTVALDYSVSNPNATALVLTRQMAGAVVNPSGAGPGCSGSSFTVNDVSGLSIPIPPGSSQVTVPGGLSAASGTSQDCQGADLNLSGVQLRFSTP